MCDCDCDPPTFHESKMVVGRKEHTCDECLRVIEKGERHQYAKGLWYGDFQDFRTCQQCLDMAKAVDLECYCYGHLVDEVDELDHGHVPGVIEFFARRGVNYEKHREMERSLELHPAE